MDSNSLSPTGSPVNSEIQAATGPASATPEDSVEHANAGSVNSDYLDQMLARLDGCVELVHSELAEYQTADSGKDASKRTDYLLTVVIPVFNELNTIGRILSRVSALPLNLEMVIVDDYSTDGTREVLQKLDGLPNVKVILKEKNAGKGAALRTGFAEATGDFVVVQDADLEYNPTDIPRLIQPLLRDEADVVYGSRFIGEEQQDESWIHRAGNAVLTGASNIFSGLKLTDMETCYKAFNREVLKDITIEQDRFGIEPEITAKLARRGYRFVEVPISYDSRGYAEGKKIGFKDLVNAIYCIGRYGMTD
ncbi:MAG: glycosyltransferase family 2 protein [Mariniblastus sp.]